MRTLIRMILQQNHNWLLLSCIVAIILISLADQLETLSLGLLTSQFDANALSGVSQNSFISSALTILTSWIVPQGLRGILTFLLGAASFKAATTFFHQYFSSLLSIRISRDLRQNYFDQIKKLGLDFYAQHPSGVLASRITTDTQWIATALNALLTVYLLLPVKLITAFILCLLLSPTLSAISFLGLPLLVGPILFFTRHLKRAAKNLQEKQESSSVLLYDFLSGIKTVQSFSREEYIAHKYAGKNHSSANAQERSALIAHLPRPITHMVGSFILSTLILIGIYLLQMPLSHLLMFCACMYQFYEPIKRFHDLNQDLQRGVAAAEKIQEVFQMKPLITDNPHALPHASFTHSLLFENVSFRYRQDQDWILKDLSFAIYPGEKVAITGSTGSGKSTILSLLLRLYEPQKGRILLDGLPLESYSLSALRNLFAVVPQDPFLFVDSVRENITFGLTLEDSVVESAAKLALADEFIAQLPNGYHSVVEEAGRNFSGGQQQRLAIARAIAKNSPIFLFDEATSALDAISEELIAKSLRNLATETSSTQIIIAHRLSTIRQVDRVIFLEKGMIQAQGTIQEVRQISTHFDQLWTLNSSTLSSASTH